MASFRSFLNSPTGPKTTHFWGPIANWGFIISGLMDTQKPPELISGNMTGGCSCLFIEMKVLCMLLVENLNDHFLLVLQFCAYTLRYS